MALTSSCQNLRRMAIRVDYQLRSMCLQRQRPYPEYDALFSSDADALRGNVAPRRCGCCRPSAGIVDINVSPS